MLGSGQWRPFSDHGGGDLTLVHLVKNLTDLTSPSCKTEWPTVATRCLVELPEEAGSLILRVSMWMDPRGFDAPVVGSAVGAGKILETACHELLFIEPNDSLPYWVVSICGALEYALDQLKASPGVVMAMDMPGGTGVGGVVFMSCVGKMDLRIPKPRGWESERSLRRPKPAPAKVEATLEVRIPATAVRSFLASR